MTSPRRSTADLIGQLNELSSSTQRPALIVLMPDGQGGGDTADVWVDDPAPLESLNAMMRRGGEPIGIVVMQHDGAGDAERIGIGMLPEHDDERSEAVLLEFMAAIRRDLQAQGYDVGDVET